MALTFQIMDGPGDFDMAIAMFRDGNVKFTIKQIKTDLHLRASLGASIIGVRACCGSRHELTIEGFISIGRTSPSFTGHYDTRSRTGSMTIDSDKRGDYPSELGDLSPTIASSK